MRAPTAIVANQFAAVKSLANQLVAAKVLVTAKSHATRAVTACAEAGSDWDLAWAT